MSYMSVIKSRTVSKALSNTLCYLQFHLTAKHDASPIIQWYVTFSGWDLLLCEVETLLDQVAQGSGMCQKASKKSKNSVKVSVLIHVVL